MFDAKKTKDQIVSWIRSYFRDNGPDCPAIIGISGGKDSSIVAALCVEALAPERVYGVLMPQGVQHDLPIAQELVAHLGIRHCVINIQSGIASLFAAMGEGGVHPNAQAEVNTPARIRMAVLYAVSAVLGGRVANTSNLSEDWVGYATKFGDTAGDFSPLARLTVTEVKAVGRKLNLPARFIDKVPEDGLSGLTDEQNLGFPYAVLDRYIRTGHCEDPAIKEKIDRLHSQNLHKLRPIPTFEGLGISG